jgi:hypothetical protein
MADEYKLVMTTKEGMVTWECKDQYSTISLTYISASLFHRLVYTKRADDILYLATPAATAGSVLQSRWTA